ncbi:hypothetical protein PGTUg99_013561 [Puccinia graminis f. sp. tritici]|uniref:Uncharacterized protein n=1 Tax=Puccinia graminis f. sp. tritici TaxID=56615 RepID=A0A5B0QHA4_PUCGR|nr:hypothetical protein PGTUg99_013561 [Puccinia graminis f. sp. tritici]
MIVNHRALVQSTEIRRLPSSIESPHRLSHRQPNNLNNNQQRNNLVSRTNRYFIPVRS